MSRILCGHCKEYHESVQEVRNCSNFGIKAIAGTRSKSEVTSKANEVPPGRYALKSADGVWKFYKVDKPTEGRWSGYIFVSILASDEKHPVKSRQVRESILAKIAEDPQRAMLDYGQQIGSCGHCGRTLTNPESIERGIGPICAGKMGW